MTVQTTPGPWFKRAPKPARFPEYTVEGPDGEHVAAIQIRAENPAGANARLIAEAPAMRDQLATLLNAAEELLIACGNPNNREGLNYKDQAFQTRALLARIEGDTK